MKIKNQERNNIFRQKKINNQYKNKPMYIKYQEIPLQATEIFLAMAILPKIQR